MNQGIKGKAAPRHIHVCDDESFHKAQASQQNKGIDLDPKPQKLHQLPKNWGCPLVIPRKLCKSQHDCDVMILISIVTMVMIRYQPWCATITSFDFWPDFPFFRSAMSVLSPWVTSTGSGMISRSNGI